MASAAVPEVVALDDIKKADEIITMAVLESKTPDPAAAADQVSPKRKQKFLSNLSLNTKRKKPTQRQYSNVFPCPMIRSELLDSPEGSASTLGLVHSSPFASLAMTSVHAKRARNAYRAGRTNSDQTTQNEVGVTRNGHFIFIGIFGNVLAIFH